MMGGRTKVRPCVNPALAQHSTSVLHIGTFRSRQNRRLIRLPSFISPHQTRTLQEVHCTLTILA